MKFARLIKLSTRCWVYIVSLQSNNFDAQIKLYCTVVQNIFTLYYFMLHEEILSLYCIQCVLQWFHLFSCECVYRHLYSAHALLKKIIWKLNFTNILFTFILTIWQSLKWHSLTHYQCIYYFQNSPKFFLSVRDYLSCHTSHTCCLLACIWPK